MVSFESYRKPIAPRGTSLLLVYVLYIALGITYAYSEQFGTKNEQSDNIVFAFLIIFSLPLVFWPLMSDKEFTSEYLKPINLEPKDDDSVLESLFKKFISGYVIAVVFPFLKLKSFLFADKNKPSLKKYEFKEYFNYYLVPFIGFVILLVAIGIAIYFNEDVINATNSVGIYYMNPSQRTTYQVIFSLLLFTTFFGLIPNKMSEALDKTWNYYLMFFFSIINLIVINVELNSNDVYRSNVLFSVYAITIVMLLYSIYNLMYLSSESKDYRILTLGRLEDEDRININGQLFDLYNAIRTIKDKKDSYFKGEYFDASKAKQSGFQASQDILKTLDGDNIEAFNNQLKVLDNRFIDLYQARMSWEKSLQRFFKAKTNDRNGIIDGFFASREFKSINRTGLKFIDDAAEALKKDWQKNRSSNLLPDNDKIKNLFSVVAATIGGQVALGSVSAKIFEDLDLQVHESSQVLFNRYMVVQMIKAYRNVYSAYKNFTIYDPNMGINETATSNNRTPPLNRDMDILRKINSFYVDLNSNINLLANSRSGDITTLGPNFNYNIFNEANDYFSENNLGIYNGDEVINDGIFFYFSDLRYRISVLIAMYNGLISNENNTLRDQKRNFYDKYSGMMDQLYNASKDSLQNIYNKYGEGNIAAGDQTTFLKDVNFSNQDLGRYNARLNPNNNNGLYIRPYDATVDDSANISNTNDKVSYKVIKPISLNTSLGNSTDVMIEDVNFSSKEDKLTLPKNVFQKGLLAPDEKIIGGNARQYFIVAYSNVLQVYGQLNVYIASRFTSNIADVNNILSLNDQIDNLLKETATKPLETNNEIIVATNARGKVWARGDTGPADGVFSPINNQDYLNVAQPTLSTSSEVTARAAARAAATAANDDDRIQNVRAAATATDAARAAARAAATALQDDARAAARAAANAAETAANDARGAANALQAAIAGNRNVGGATGLRARAVAAAQDAANAAAAATAAASNEKVPSLFIYADFVFSSTEVNRKYLVRAMTEIDSLKNNFNSEISRAKNETPGLAGKVSSFFSSSKPINESIKFFDLSNKENLKTVDNLEDDFKYSWKNNPNDNTGLNINAQKAKEYIEYFNSSGITQNNKYYNLTTEQKNTIIKTKFFQKIYNYYFQENIQNSDAINKLFIKLENIYKSYVKIIKYYILASRESNKEKYRNITLQLKKEIELVNQGFPEDFKGGEDIFNKDQIETIIDVGRLEAEENTEFYSDLQIRATTAELTSRKTLAELETIRKASQKQKSAIIAGKSQFFRELINNLVAGKAGPVNIRIGDKTEKMVNIGYYDKTADELLKITGNFQTLSYQAYTFMVRILIQMYKTFAVGVDAINTALAANNNYYEVPPIGATASNATGFFTLLLSSLFLSTFTGGPGNANDSTLKMDDVINSVRTHINLPVAPVAPVAPAAGAPVAPADVEGKDITENRMLFRDNNGVNPTDNTPQSYQNFINTASTNLSQNIDKVTYQNNYDIIKGQLTNIKKQLSLELENLSISMQTNIGSRGTVKKELKTMVGKGVQKDNLYFYILMIIFGNKDKINPGNNNSNYDSNNNGTLALENTNGRLVNLLKSGNNNVNYKYIISSDNLGKKLNQNEIDKLIDILEWDYQKLSEDPTYENNPLEKLREMIIEHPIINALNNITE